MALTSVERDSRRGQAGSSLRRRRRSCGRGDALGGRSRSATSSQRRLKWRRPLAFWKLSAYFFTGYCRVCPFTGIMGARGNCIGISG
jgi:hypothetical protein